MRERGVIGLDLSLTRSAAVYIPPGWRPGSGKHLRSMTAGYGIEGNSPAERAERLRTIVQAIEKFVGDCGANTVWVEDYVFGRGEKSGIALGELGGAVKVWLLAKRGIVVRPINVATARKYLLGKIPTGKGAAIKATHGMLRELEILPGDDEADARDAFVVANAARAALGMPGITIA